MPGPEDGVVAHRQVVERRVLDREVALPHRALDVHDRVAGGAGEAGLALRRVSLALDRLTELAGEEHRVVVAASAPAGGLGPDHGLHVLDRPPVPLVVERGEVVRRRVPLLVDGLVTAAAFLAGHEEVRRDRAAHVRLARGGEERTVPALPLAVHRQGRQLRVRDHLLGRSEVGDGARQRSRHGQDGGRDPEAPRQRAERREVAQAGQQGQQGRRGHESDVDVEQGPVAVGSTDHGQQQPEGGAGGEETRRHASQGRKARPVTAQQETDRDRDDDAERDVQDDVREVEEGRVGARGEVEAVGAHGERQAREDPFPAHPGPSPRTRRSLDTDPRRAPVDAARLTEFRSREAIAMPIHAPRSPDSRCARLL